MSAPYWNVPVASGSGSFGSVGASPSREPKVENLALPSWAHREAIYWYPEWTMIRDACAGERAVKSKGTLYLPRLEGMSDPGEYASYLDRATFYPFTGKTSAALSGSIFRREHQFENFPQSLTENLRSFSKDNQTFRTFAMYASEEILKMGRVGLFLDMPAVERTQPRPYVTAYTAENIVDWEYGEIDGRNELVRVVLREERRSEAAADAGMIVPQFRQLRLTSLGSDREYVQEIFYDDAPKTDNPLKLTPEFLKQTIRPRRRGAPLDYVPFVMVVDLDRPPMQDIARLNLSHFRSYAHLEHGRLFTGFPVYYVEQPQGGGEGDSEFVIGASTVWITPPGAKPGLLEMNGQGLKFLENALDQKEQQAAALGGRMMGIRTNATTESNNLLKISERNEQCVLLKVTLALDDAFTRILRWWAYLYDIAEATADKIAVEFSKDFLFDNGGAREFRAIQAMYKDGVIPIEVVYAYLRKSEVVPDWMSQEDFKKLLDSAASFPNEPNFEARQEGFADAKSRDLGAQNDDTNETNLEIATGIQDGTTERQDSQNEFDAKQNDKKAQQAVKLAKAAPKPVPGAPPAPGAPGQRPPPPKKA